MPNAQKKRGPGKSKSTANRPLVVPDYFAAALQENKKALAAFEHFPPSHKREYVKWVSEAKREETRQKRLAAALARLAGGKSKTNS